METNKEKLNVIRQKFIEKYDTNMWRHLTESYYGSYYPKTFEERTKNQRMVIEAMANIFNLNED